MWHEAELPEDILVWYTKSLSKSWGIPHVHFSTLIIFFKKEECVRQAAGDYWANTNLLCS